MRRIALILLLYVLLSSAPPDVPDPPLRETAMQLVAAPLPLPSAAVQQLYRPLRLTGLWRLDADLEAFGGLSAMVADEGGRFIAINDGGNVARFSLDGMAGRMAALPQPAAVTARHRKPNDSESMTRDPRTGRIWVGFEGMQRICRYAPDLARRERCGTSDAFRDWPKEGGLESLVRFADGRFLALGERANAPSGGYDVLLWQGDPAEADTPPPVHLSYRAPVGYRPTDAIWLGGDRLLVLNRRFTVFDGFTARLTLVRLPPLEEGVVLRGAVVAAFERPGSVDNLEALALGGDADGPVLWIASDDNHLSVQRTLLYRFALPPAWLSEAPAP